MLSDLCLISLNDILREGLHRILTLDGFNVLISCSRAETVANATFKSECSVVIDLPDQNACIEAIEKVATAHPNAKIAVLVEQFDMGRLIECFDAGANGYIVKTVNSQPLIAALRLVTLGQKVLPSELAEVLSKHNFNHAMPNRNLTNEMEVARLSSRERDVLCCLMAGYPNKVIARELDVCEATVKVHVKAILRKLDVCNRTQAAIWASTRGFSNYRLSSQGGTDLAHA